MNLALDAVQNVELHALVDNEEWRKEGGSEDNGHAGLQPAVSSGPDDSLPPASSGQPLRSAKVVDIPGPVAERYTRTKEHRAQAKGKKAGPSGRFKGEQLEFLQSKVADYEALAGMSKAKRRDSLEKFWHAVITNGFWVKFDLGDVRGTVPGHPSMEDEEIIAAVNSVSMYASIRDEELTVIN